jgi:hypothetical protein
MYKLINNISGVGGYNIHNDKLFIHRDIDNRCQVLCECNQDLIPLWKSPEDIINDIFYADSFFVYCSGQSKKTVSRNYDYSLN